MDIDVKKVLLALAERQKEYVLTDLEKYGEAMAVVFTSKNSSYLEFPVFEDGKSKKAAYQAIVQRAKSENAALIVTVNNARTNRSAPQGEFETYKWGDLDSSNSDPCILLTASGVGLNSCSLEITYVISGKQVIFSEPAWLFDIELNLLPGWADAI